MATYTAARKSAAKPDDTLLRRTYVLGDSKVKLELRLPGDLPLEQIDALLADFAGAIEQALLAHRSATRAHQHRLPDAKTRDKTTGYETPEEDWIRA